MFSVCDPETTCTGYKKECNGDVCKCKNGYMEDPAILNPGGQDDCVVKESRENCIFSDRLFCFHCLWRIGIMVDCLHIFRTENAQGFDFYVLSFYPTKSNSKSILILI